MLLVYYTSLKHELKLGLITNPFESSRASSCSRETRFISSPVLGLKSAGFTHSEADFKQQYTYSVAVQPITHMQENT